MAPILFTIFEGIFYVSSPYEYVIVVSPKQVLEFCGKHIRLCGPNCSSDACKHVAQGQPFRLGLLQFFATATQDPDSNLCGMLENGVSTGIFEPIESSMQWVQQAQHIEDPDLHGLHLLHCQGNWTQAEKNPQLLDELVANEVKQGWVKPFAGTLEQAEKKWPGRTAVGKLNIVMAEGRDPRLVLDSSICNAKAKSKVPEKLAMPSGLDVARTFQHEDPRGAFVGVSLDFKAAHKGIQLQEQDQGCMLFRVPTSSTTMWYATSALDFPLTGGKG